MLDKMKDALGQFQMMQKLMQNGHFKTFISHPKVQELFQDLEFKEVAQSKDFSKIMAHPKFAALMQDPELASLLAKMNLGEFLKK